MAPTPSPPSGQDHDVTDVLAQLLQMRRVAGRFGQHAVRPGGRSRSSPPPDRALDLERTHLEATRAWCEAVTTDAVVMRRTVFHSHPLAQPRPSHRSRRLRCMRRAPALPRQVLGAFNVFDDRELKGADGRALVSVRRRRDSRPGRSRLAQHSDPRVARGCSAPVAARSSSRPRACWPTSSRYHREGIQHPCDAAGTCTKCDGDGARTSSKAPIVRDPQLWRCVGP